MLITAPVWLASGPHVVGESAGLDLTGSYWAHWWAADALSRGVSPFVGTHSFYPTGSTPVLQYNLLDGIVHAPLVASFGPRVGYNLACVAALWLTGVAAHRLGRSAGTSRSAALLTGVLVQSSSYVALELHCGRISQVVLVFFLLALSLTVDVLSGRGRTLKAVGAGVLAGGAALVYWYHGAALLLVGMGLVWSHRHALGGPQARALMVAVASGAAVVGPALAMLVTSWADLPGIERTDAAGIIEANSRGILWPVVNLDPVFGHQLSGAALGLAALAVYRRARHWGVWLGVAALGWVLALGPGGSVWLPFDGLQRMVPGFDRMWWPYRLEVLAVVAVAVLAGLGLDRWLQNRSRPRVWTGLVLVAVWVDAPLRSGLLPVTASEVFAPSERTYRDLSGPLLTVPLQPSAVEVERMMLAQTVHEQPIPVGDGAHLPSHVPPAHRDWLTSNGLLRLLATLERTGNAQGVVTPADVNQLVADGFRYAVVDPDVMDGGAAMARAAAYSEIFRALWGDAVRPARGGGAWAISALAADVELSVAVRQGPGRSGRRRTR